MCAAHESPIRRAFFSPLMAPLMESRRVSAWLGLAGTAQIVLTQLHIGGVTCPFFHATGIPCPGCGLSRACAAFVRGDWHTWLRMHAFAPFFLLGILLFLASATLRSRARDRLAWVVVRVERRGATALLLFAMVVYWLIRLGYSPDRFISLIKS